MKPTLIWGMKQSFRDYVFAAGGSQRVEEPAVLNEEICVFPIAGPSDADRIHRYSGILEFEAYLGMLRVRIADPWVELRDGGPILSVSTGESRIALAALDTTDPETEHGLLVWDDVPAALLESGTFLFDHSYSPGTPLDPVSFSTPA